MAISGVVDADIERIAKNLGVARTGGGATGMSVAGQLGYTYQAAAVSAADSGGHVMTLTLTNCKGVATVDWGDGTKSSANASVATMAHTYAAAGTKTWDFSCYGVHRGGSLAIA